MYRNTSFLNLTFDGPAKFTLKTALHRPFSDTKAKCKKDPGWQQHCDAIVGQQLK